MFETTIQFLRLRLDVYIYADLSCDDVGYVTPQVKRTVLKTRSSPTSSNQKKSPLLNCDVTKPKASKFSYQMDIGRASSEKVEVAVQQSPLSEEMAGEEQRGSEHGVSGMEDSGSWTNSRLQAKRTLFKESSDGKSNNRFGGSRFGARVVPLFENEDCEPSAVDSQQEFENLSLIQKQLLQIENQQSSLLELLQVNLSFP